jgi:hypothetical protein
MNMPNKIGLHCDDCGFGTLLLNEYYMVTDTVWKQAWAGHRKWWHLEILCIGCLEARLNRKLTRDDFIDAPINNPDSEYMSERLLDRICAASTKRRHEPTQTKENNSCVQHVYVATANNS